MNTCWGFLSGKVVIPSEVEFDKVKKYAKTVVYNLRAASADKKQTEFKNTASLPNDNDDSISYESDEEVQHRHTPERTLRSSSKPSSLKQTGLSFPPTTKRKASLSRQATSSKNNNSGIR
jgi:hypothetical protein